MTIDTGELLTLNDVAKLLPSIDGKRINISTIWRWCCKGSRGVQLEYTRLGSRILTTEAAVHEFMAARTEADGQPTASSRPRTTAQRERAVGVAYAELRHRGVSVSGPRETASTKTPRGLVDRRG